MAWLSCIDDDTSAAAAQVRLARQDVRPRPVAGAAPGPAQSRSGAAA